MIPRNVSRHIILSSCLALIALGLPAQTENALATPGLNQGMTKGYCASDPSGPVVYFSSIFEAHANLHWSISAEPLNFAFKNYLIEEYDFKSSSNYPINCGLFETLSQAETSKRQLVTEAQRAKKQIVEVNWKPGPGVEVLQSADPNFMPIAPPTPTHTFCAVGHESTMYFSAVFDTVGALINPKWNDAFNEFLNKRYGFQAEVEATCTILNTVREAERNLNARVAGVRANSHKAVETGWKYDPTVAITKPALRPKPKDDDDPEPQQRPAAKTPSTDIRDFAAKEGSAALTQCQNDRVMSGAFDCYRVQRAVYNYRIEHAGDVRPEPLASLLDKLDCSQCIIDYLVKMWAKSAAQSRGLQPNAAECVAERFLTLLHAKPFPGRAKEIFNGAVTACNRQ